MALTCAHSFQKKRIFISHEMKRVRARKRAVRSAARSAASDRNRSKSTKRSLVAKRPGARAQPASQSQICEKTPKKMEVFRKNAKKWGFLAQFGQAKGVFGVLGVFGRAQRILGEIFDFARRTRRGARTSRQIKIRRKNRQVRRTPPGARTSARSCCRKIASYEGTPDYRSEVRALVSKRVKLKWGAYLTQL